MFVELILKCESRGKGIENEILREDEFLILDVSASKIGKKATWRNVHVMVGNLMERLPFE